jgi:rhamnosyltransferase
MEYNVCAVVTAYYPDISVVENINQLAKFVSIIFIMDNTPKIDNAFMFNNSNIIYYASKKNLGLSRAFNECLKNNMAAKKSDFILFMDQDSYIPENLVKVLINDYYVLSDLGYKIGCLGPAIFERNMNIVMLPSHKKNILNNIYKVTEIITSSMLTTYKNLEKIGFWNENIFLDFADWELCWRFQKNGFMCYITRNVFLNHRLGHSIKNICGYEIIDDNPIREYYQARDGIKLLFESYTPLKYKIYFITLIAFRPFLHILFLRNRYLRIKYIVIGIFDFFRRRSGAKS